MKRKWELTADPAEIAALQAILGTEAEMPMMAEGCASTMTSEELPAAQVDCQAKRYCTQMKSCAEARAYPKRSCFCIEFLVTEKSATEYSAVNRLSIGRQLKSKRGVGHR